MVDGIDFVIGQAADLTARFNKKTWLVGTGAQIAASTSGLEQGKHAHCTSTGSGFINGQDYRYSGTAWQRISTLFNTELGRLSATAAATSIVVPSLPAARFLHVIIAIHNQTSTALYGIQFNADTGANYTYTTSTDGAVDVGAAGQTSVSTILTLNAGDLLTTQLSTLYNLATTTKGAHINSRRQTGSAVVRNEGDFNWNNTSAQISSVTLMRISGTGTMTTDSQIVVMGND